MGKEKKLGLKKAEVQRLTTPLARDEQKEIKGGFEEMQGITSIRIFC